MTELTTTKPDQLCANCMNSYQGENGQTAKWEPHFEVKPVKSTSHEVTTVKFVDALAHIFGIDWNNFYEEERHLQFAISSDVVMGPATDIIFCANCASYLSEMYHVYCQFEDLTCPGSMMKRLNDFQLRKLSFKSLMKTESPENEIVQVEQECQNYDGFSDNESLNNDENDPIELKYVPIDAEEQNFTQNKGLGPQEKIEGRKMKKTLIIKLERLTETKIKTKPPKMSMKILRRKKSRSLGGNFKGKKESSFGGKMKKGKSKSNYEWIENGFSCEICGKMFNSRRCKYRHKEIHKPNQSFDCRECGKQLANKESLRFHRITLHVSESEKLKRKTTCEKCGKVMSTVYYQKHLEIVHNEDRITLECKKCRRTFLSEEKYQQHLESHFSTRNFNCEFCLKTFPTLHILNRHVDKHHSTPKSFLCDQCPMRFLQECDLKSHQVSHTFERPFKCSKCEKTFRSRANLNAHKRAHRDEEGGQEFPCLPCQRLFKNRKSLYCHTARYHRDDLSSKATLSRQRTTSRGPVPVTIPEQDPLAL